MENDGVVYFLHNAMRRKINLCVDTLNSRKRRKLWTNITKKMTEMGNLDFIQAMLDGLDLFTCQHYYLHETRMNRQAVIWRTKNG